MARPMLLVVDDDPCTRTALDTLLTRRGWHVVVAATLAEALEALEPAPDCVILDLNLPDGRGETILKRVRADSPHTRVAVCSAATDAVRLASVRGMQPDLMLWKPIEMEAVYRLCEQARVGRA